MVWSIAHAGMRAGRLLCAHPDVLPNITRGINASNVPVPALVPAREVSKQLKDQHESHHQLLRGLTATSHA